MKRLLAILGLLLALTPSAFSGEGAFDVFSSETLFVDGHQWYWTARYKPQTHMQQGGSRISNPLKNKRTEWLNTVGWTYGLSEGLTVGAFMSHYRRAFRQVPSHTGRVTGWGDLTLYAKYRLLHVTWKQSGYYISAIGAVDLPTGRTNHKDRGQRVADTLQPGRGALVQSYGLAQGLELHRFGISNTNLYQVSPTGAHHFNAGNVFTTSLQFKYRVYQYPFPGASGGVRVGAVYRHAERHQKRGVVQRNSGGTRMDLKVGWMHHPAPDWDVEVFWQIPVRLHAHGTQLVPDYSLRFTLGQRF